MIDEFLVQKKAMNADYTGFLFKKVNPDICAQDEWIRDTLFTIIRMLQKRTLSINDEILKMNQNKNEIFISANIKDRFGEIHPAKVIKKLNIKPNSYEIRIDGKYNHIRICFFTGPRKFLKNNEVVALAYMLDKAMIGSNAEGYFNELILDSHICRSSINEININELLEELD